LTQIMKDIEARTMKTYETEIGVSGVGILSNLHHHHQLQDSIKKTYLTSNLSNLSQSLSTLALRQSEIISRGTPSAPGSSHPQDLFWSFA